MVLNLTFSSQFYLKMKKKFPSGRVLKEICPCFNPIKPLIMA